MIKEYVYLVEKHLQQDSKEPNIDQLVKAARKYKKKLRPSVTITEDAMRKARVCQEMATLVSGNFEGWDLRYNEPGYGSNGCPVDHGLFSVSVYRGKKFMGHRLIAPQASSEKALAEIANTFLLVMQRVKEVEQKS